MAISVDGRDKSVTLVKRLNLQIPLLSDPQMKVIKAYGVAMEGRDIAVPSVFIVDRKKQILYRYIGESMTDRPDSDDLLARVRALQTPASQKITPARQKNIPASK